VFEANLRAPLQGQDYSDNGNHQSDANYDWPIFITVSEAGQYDISAWFVSRTMTVNAGSSPSGPGYGYFGAGGGTGIVHNFDILYTTGFLRNYDVQTPNHTFYHSTGPVTLEANTTYQLYVGSYMYAGWGGPVIVDYNTGIDLIRQVDAVPEPASLALAATGGLLFLGIRRRRR
jgi:hypothetical protein